MLMSALASALVTFKRLTDKIVDAVAVTSSVTVIRQPSRECCLQVYLTGSPSGTVILTGLVNGSSASETLTFSAGGVQTTMNQFSSVTSITTSLSGGVLIDVRAVDPDGSPQTWYYTLKTGHPVSFRAGGRQNQVQERGGQVTKNAMKARVDYEDVWEPLQQDVVYNESTGETFVVTGVETQMNSFLAPRSWLLTLEEDEGR